VAVVTGVRDDTFAVAGTLVSGEAANLGQRAQRIHR
jgi:hypothetical protein